MKRIKKTYTGSNQEIIEKDIKNAFNLISNLNETKYLITLSDFPQTSLEEIKFIIKNKFLNQIWKEYKNTATPIDYLFVLEFGSIISKPNEFKKVNDLGIHAHIILNTSIHNLTLEYFINILLGKIDYKIQDIGKNKNLYELGGYLTKQRKYLTSDNYEYKALIHN